MTDLSRDKKTRDFHEPSGRCDAAKTIQKYGVVGGRVFPWWCVTVGVAPAPPGVRKPMSGRVAWSWTMRYQDIRRMKPR